MTEQELTDLTKEAYGKALETLVEIMQIAPQDLKVSAAATILDVVASAAPPR